MSTIDSINVLDKKSISVGNIDIDKLNNYSLHYLVKDKEIQVGIIDNEEGKQLLFETYSVKGGANNITSENLKSIILDHHVLQAGFWQDVTIGFSNQIFSLIPTSLFDDNNKAEYLKLTDFEESGLDLCSYKQASTDIVNVFGSDSRFTLVLKELYPNIIIREVHESAAFLESCLRESNGENTVFINVESQYFTLCVVKGGKLIFLNSFNFHTTEDFAYYTIVALKELKIDLETEGVQIWGEMAHESPLYEILYKYIRFVEFGKRPDFIKFSFHFDEIIDHKYYTMFSQNLCK